MSANTSRPRNKVQKKKKRKKVVGDKLNSDQKRATLQLLFDYKDIFACSLLEVKECKAPPMKLTLHTNQKMFKRQYKLNDEDSKEASRQIKEMLNNEIIEPSDTAYYNSPVFLIKKKDGSRRFIVDLRGINSLVVPRLVQLPNIDDILHDILSKKPLYYSSIDLRSAYWQLC